MSEPIKITPVLLADIEAKANATLSRPGTWGFQGASAIHAFQSAANPAVMLAMIGRIRQLEAAQCWAIVTIETGVIDGPYATKEAAENERLAELCDDPNEPMYRFEPWKGGAE